MIKALFGKPRVLASFRSPVCRTMSNYLYKKPQILKTTNFSFEQQMDFEMSLAAKCQVRAGLALRSRSWSRGGWCT